MQRRLWSITWKLIPFTHFDPAKVKPN